MQRPSIVRLDRTVTKTALAISSTSACGADERNVSVEIHRIGVHDEPLRYCAAQRDEDLRYVFVWDVRVRCLPAGLYRLRFFAACTPCGELLMQMRDDCAVTSAENVDFDTACGPIDSSQPDCAAACGAACGCDPAPVIYVPPYDVPRGC
jgi:hypothetical protein